MAATVATVAARAGANETATAAPTAAETGAAAAGATTAGLTTAGLTTAFEALVRGPSARVGRAQCSAPSSACGRARCAKNESL